MKEDKLPTYITKINSVYYFRIAIPKDIKDQFGNRNHVKVSLRTKELSEAKTLMPLQLAKTQSEFAAKRKGIKNSKTQPPLKEKDTLSAFSKAEIETLVYLYESQREEEYKNFFKNIQGDSEGWEDIIETAETDLNYTADLMSDNPSMIEDKKFTNAKAFLEKREITFKFNTPNFIEFAKKLAEAEYDVNVRNVARLKRNPVEKLVRPNNIDIDRLELGKERMTLDKLFEIYKQKNGKTWDQQTLDGYLRKIEIFNDIWGKDKNLALVTKQDCLDLADALYKQPKLLRKNYPREKYTYKQALKQAQKDGKDEVLSYSGVSKYLSLLTSLLKLATKNEYISKNYALDIERKESKQDKKKREREKFTDEQLNAIFKAPSPSS